MNKILKNKIANHYLSILRSKETSIKDFRDSLNKITRVLLIESSDELELINVKIDTPMASDVLQKTFSNDMVFVPILRAGLGMVDEVISVYPHSKIIPIGVKRDETTLSPTVYYKNFQDDDFYNKVVFVLDPMLATGSSLTYVLDTLIPKKPKKIIYLGVIASRYAYNKLTKEYPNVSFYLAACDEVLNEEGYIVPGLGDCGDRYFGT